MIINLCGFGWSGSGAFLDLLKEYEDVTFPNRKHFEFNFLWVPDGLYDLEQKLCYKHCRIFDSDLAIRRFLALAKQYGDKKGFYKYDKFFDIPFYEQCENYINELVQFNLEAYCLVHRLHPTVKDKFVEKFNYIIQKILRNRISLLFFDSDVYYRFRISNLKKMRISYSPDNFLEITQNFVDSILKQIRSGCEKPLVLDQSVPPDMPQLFDHFFKEDHKTIVVRRDPRDTFITIRELKGISRPVPTHVDDFITFYRKTICNTKLKDSDILLSLNFEDLIYKYDETTKKIENFLGIKKHKLKYNFFDPLKSINNTQLLELFPKYQNEICKIEMALPEFLYPFEHKVNRTTNKIF